METYFTSHAFGFWVGLLAAVLILALWMGYTAVHQWRTRAHYDAVLRSVETGNVPAMLTQYLTTVRDVAERTEDMDRRVSELHGAFPGSIRHMGLVRFSPFHDTGGDQSFSLAMLDGKGDGIVISALHSRRDHRLYAKPVIGQKSAYPLTKEEQQAIANSLETGITMEAPVTL